MLAHVLVDQGAHLRRAAEGLTDPQIAQALFVTPKTIQTHLAHTYRKLDIASRRQLPATLRGAAGTLVVFAPEVRPPAMLRVLGGKDQPAMADANNPDCRQGRPSCSRDRTCA